MVPNPTPQSPIHNCRGRWCCGRARCAGTWSWSSQATSNPLSPQSPMPTLIMYRLGFNQNYYSFTLILLTQIVMRSKFSWNKFISYRCFELRSLSAGVGGAAGGPGAPAPDPDRVGRRRGHPLRAQGCCPPPGTFHRWSMRGTWNTPFAYCKSTFDERLVHHREVPDTRAILWQQKHF